MNLIKPLYLKRLIITTRSLRPAPLVAQFHGYSSTQSLPQRCRSLGKLLQTSPFAREEPSSTAAKSSPSANARNRSIRLETRSAITIPAHDSPRDIDVSEFPPHFPGISRDVDASRGQTSIAESLAVGSRGSSRSRELFGRGKFPARAIAAARETSPGIGAVGGSATTGPTTAEGVATGRAT